MRGIFLSGFFIVAYELGFHEAHFIFAYVCVDMSCDIDCKLELVQLYYTNGESLTACMRAYKKTHGLHNNPFSLETIRRVIKRFEKSKTLHNKRKIGRRSLIADRTDIVTTSLQQLQQQNPHGHASCSTVSQSTGIPTTSVWRILRGVGMHAYKISLTQALTEDDYPKRLAFAHWVQENIDSLNNIIWSDEAYFSLDGNVNRHNCTIWAYENPHQQQHKSLHPQKLCVWIGFSATCKLQPFFFDTTVDQHNYGTMLEQHVFPELRRQKKINSSIFQHDGAPPHYAISVRQKLASIFPENRVIGRGYGTPWPPRSPDLTPCDYYLWGTLKARIFHCYKPANLNALKEKNCKSSMKSLRMNWLTVCKV